MKSLHTYLCGQPAGLSCTGAVEWRVTHGRLPIERAAALRWQMCIASITVLILNALTFEMQRPWMLKMKSHMFCKGNANRSHLSLHLSKGNSQCTWRNDFLLRARLWSFLSGGLVEKAASNRSSQSYDLSIRNRSRKSEASLYNCQISGKSAHLYGVTFVRQPPATTTITVTTRIHLHSLAL